MLFTSYARPGNLFTVSHFQPRINPPRRLSADRPVTGVPTEHQPEGQGLGSSSRKLSPGAWQEGLPLWHQLVFPALERAEIRNSLYANDKTPYAHFSGTCRE